MKNTKGPWRVTENGYIAGDYYVPIRTPFREDAFRGGPERSDHPEEELQANARLIASAPELLAAVQAFLDGFADGSIKWTKPRRSDSDPYHPANVLACAAIAKIEGRD